MLTNNLRAGAVGAEAASRYGLGSDQMMRLRLRNTGNFSAEKFNTTTIYYFHRIFEAPFAVNVLPVQDNSKVFEIKIFFFVENLALNYFYVSLVDFT
jgi:hypothetical protein